MLNRSLFEDMVDAHWVSKNGDLALKQLVEHDKWSNFLREKVRKDFPEYMKDDERVVEEPNVEQKKKSIDLYGQYGQYSWTGLPLYKRVEEIESCWHDEEDRRLLRFHFKFMNRVNNEILHPTSYSFFRSPMTPSKVDDGWSFQMGASKELLPHALYNAFYNYNQLIGLMYETFDLKHKDKFESHYLESTAKAFFPISDEDATDVGRNDPCPCGSGKKYKRCHGP